MLRTSLLRARALAGFVRLVKDPNRLAEVFAIADTLSETDTAMFRAMRDDFARDPQGKRALSDKPRIGAVDLEALARLPEGTLGRCFAEHMKKNGLDPSAIPTRPANDELQFIKSHLYETHDVWHVLTGFGADVPGELGLQAFYALQVEGKLPSIILTIGFANTALFAHGEREPRLRAIVRGYLLGRSARKLFGADWASMWTRPLAEVRREFRIDVEGVDALMARA